MGEVVNVSMIKYVRSFRDIMKLNTILSLIIMILSLWGLMATVLLSNLEPLTSSVRSIKVKILTISIILFFLALGIFLFACFRISNLNNIDRIFIAVGYFIISFAAAWILFGLFIYVMQDKLLFGPSSASPERLNEVRKQEDIEEISIKVLDDTVLHGWLVKQENKENKDKSPLVIIFAGQGGDITSHIKHARKIHGCYVALINYRGYGLSQGTPSETAFYNDAVEIFDYFSKRQDINKEKIFALGGSLGTGVAVHLAAHAPLAGIILFSPYDKIAGGVVRDIIPFIPSSIMFRNSFNAIKDAPLVNEPVLALIGENDLVIRPKRSEKLIRLWGETCTKVILEGADHYSIYDIDESWNHVNDFISNIIG